MKLFSGFLLVLDVLSVSAMWLCLLGVRQVQDPIAKQTLAFAAVVFAAIVLCFCFAKFRHVSRLNRDTARIRKETAELRRRAPASRPGETEVTS